MSLTLLGLAAGMGSRFGGPKQLEPLGPHGETILDYSVYDALGAGFDAVVLVIRAELRERFERGLVARWRGRVAATLVEQPVEATRAKPWGTAHAVLAAADAVGGPFAVVNGDDFYGRDTLARLGAFLRGARPDAATYAVVGFPLGATLSDVGGVNRAVLETDADGTLRHVEELRGLTATALPAGVTRDSLVSLNTWAFTPAVLPQLAEAFDAFRARHAGDDGAELLVQDVVESLIAERRATVRVLPGVGPWHGMTYREDRPRVAAALADLAARGEYPSPVWR